MKRVFTCNTHACAGVTVVRDGLPRDCPDCGQRNWVELPAIADTPEEKLQVAVKQAESLAHRLFDSQVLPCSDHKAGLPTSCIAKEAKRAGELTAAEKSKGWVQRPFDYYDPDKMCLACRAYWYAALSRNSLQQLLSLQRWAEARTQTKTVSSTSPQEIADAVPHSAVDSAPGASAPGASATHADGGS
jgi:hypothetical protein